VQQVACDVHRFHWQEGKEASEGTGEKRAPNQAAKQTNKRTNKQTNKQPIKQTNKQTNACTWECTIGSRSLVRTFANRHISRRRLRPDNVRQWPLCAACAVREYIGLATGSHASHTTQAGIQRAPHGLASRLKENVFFFCRLAAGEQNTVFCRLAAYNTTHDSRTRMPRGGACASSLPEASAVAAHTGACDTRVTTHATHAGACNACGGMRGRQRLLAYGAGSAHHATACALTCWVQGAAAPDAAVLS
jgi:hypothetical protein